MGKIKKIKNLVSFIYPVMIEACAGNVTPYLEVMKSKGKYVLNSKNANYSFGGLHTIFDTLFYEIKIQQLDFKNVLILGMGAGSIVSLLKDKYKLNCSITAIEKDEVIIELAKKYFKIKNYSLLTILNTDAYDYVLNSENKYDLIISDLFIDNNVPEIFTSIEYLKNLRRIANDKCCIMYNKMTEEPHHKKELLVLSHNFEQFFPNHEVRKLYANHFENSVLLYNTLPVFKKDLSTSGIVKTIDKTIYPKLNPVFK